MNLDSTKSLEIFSSQELMTFSSEKPKINCFLEKLKENHVYDTMYNTEVISAKVLVDITVNGKKTETDFYINATTVINSELYTELFKSIISLLENNSENGKNEFKISLAALLRGNKKPNYLGAMGFTYRSDRNQLDFSKISSSHKNVEEVKSRIPEVMDSLRYPIPRIVDQPQFNDDFELIFPEKCTSLNSTLQLFG